jgi:Transposase zinc-binding domain
MARPALEVADVFRDHGAAWRHANRGHVSLLQLKVMSAIENCRTAALGGHVARCEDCAHTTIAYNSCRNRHCPKCQGAAARQWMAAREAELLPIPYFHVVFTLPSAVGDVAYQNKAVIYDLLFKASSETMLRIAADPKHLAARIGITSVLHTWGSTIAVAAWAQPIRDSIKKNAPHIALHYFLEHQKPHVPNLHVPNL